MIKLEVIKQLRERTGAGIMDCKHALVKHGGDMGKALNFLREKGISKGKANRIAAEGIVDSYIHGNGRIGVLLEVNIETDFAALSKEFREFVKDLGMQIAAVAPKYIGREDIPLEVIENEKATIKAQANIAGKSENIVGKIIEGRMEKFYKQVCLLEQPFIKDPDISIQQLLNNKISIIGENIIIRRFVRFESGEGLKKVIIP
ncbi:translation elongation factor Ts [Pseudobacteroides cellulosolvens]|uniref:Elongation factor Ts n=1 Tax=Pseudobacteroides cellulosolvens ATCC 35603 = DSM 2933 TaxID=398512 RepID=A0A0L6JWQ2_9FIRM|nr:translation elongation factor Ts [Pseudobacteroides cellulosolvens]KNY30276.1 Elongation factor Ts [Pseudobacteroides cellulosolvens ATCC 35603 = DSM 2933]